MLAGGERCLIHRCDLRHADAGDDAGGADRPGADTDLYGVRSGIHERLRATAGRDVATNHVDMAGNRVALEPADDVDHAGAVAVRGVDDEGIDTGVDECHSAIPGVTEKADCGRDPEPAILVFRGLRIFLRLVKVLDGDETAQPAIGVDERQLLDLVLRENRDGVIRVDALWCSNQRCARHNVPNERRRLLERGDEAHVAVGDYSDEPPIAFDHREA